MEKDEKKFTRHLSLKLPSGVAVELTRTDGQNPDGKPTSTILVERKDGIPVTPAVMEEAKQALSSIQSAYDRSVREISFGQFLRDVVENFPLGRNELRFSRKWFDDVDRTALIVLSAGGMCDVWTHKPVSPEAFEYQRRIARVIIQRAETGQRALKAGNRSLADRCGTEIQHFFARMV